MENASQALIIAGAILLAILIVAVGMFVYNKANNSIQSATRDMDASEIKVHNSFFTDYNGVQNGATVKGFLSGWAQRVAPDGTPAERKPKLTLEGKKGTVTATESFEITNALQELEMAARYDVKANAGENGLISEVIIEKRDGKK